MSDDKLDQHLTAADLVGMHQLAAENGDGFTPCFLELLEQAHRHEAPPRLIVVNDKVRGTTSRAYEDDLPVLKAVHGVKSSSNTD